MELFHSAMDEDGFQLVQEKESDRLRYWLHGSSSRNDAPSVTDNSTDQQAVASNPRSIPILTRSSLRTMTNIERRSLYDHWITEQAAERNNDLLNALESYNEVKAELDKCNQEIQLRCLLQAQIIGCTTTGLARNLDVLRKVRTKIVLVEEAGKRTSPALFLLLLFHELGSWGRQKRKSLLLLLITSQRRATAILVLLTRVANSNDA